VFLGSLGFVSTASFKVDDYGLMQSSRASSTVAAVVMISPVKPRLASNGIRPQ